MGASHPVQRPLTCPRCGTVLNQPVWSESVSEQQVANVWRCTSCGYQCETRDEGVAHEPSAAELAEEFLPNLVVE
jgi:transcription elongation factor Elf1